MTDEELRMEAYYYGFDKTGQIEIDRILSAVACAGKAFHHTNDWNDEATPRTFHEGATPIDWIQNRAKEAADTIEALRAENARLKVALKPLAALRKEILDEKGQPSGDFSFDHYTDDQTVFFLDTKRIITAGDIRTAYQLLSNSQ